MQLQVSSHAVAFEFQQDEDGGVCQHRHDEPHIMMSQRYHSSQDAWGGKGGGHVGIKRG